MQYRNDAVLITKDGKPVAALVDVALFERIRRMRDEFIRLTDDSAKPTQERIRPLRRPKSPRRSAAGAFEIVLCEPILEEIGAALHYPKVRKRIALSDEELDRYVQALRFMADVVDPAGASVSVPGDRDDDVILGTLVAGNADWRVTGDAVLLALAGKYPICTPAEFASRHLP